MRANQLGADRSEVQRDLQRTSCCQPFPNAAGYRCVAAKADADLRTPVTTKRLERLLAEFRLFLVDRGQVATIANVDEAERDIAGAGAREIVFPVGIDALDNHVGPEAVHRHAGDETVVQVASRSLRDHQDPVIVDEAGRSFVPRWILNATLPEKARVAGNELEASSEIISEPFRRLITGEKRRHPLSEKLDFATLRRLRLTRNDEFGHAGGVQNQLVFDERRLHEGKLWILALGDEHPGFVDHHPVPVAEKSGRGQLDFTHADALAGFDGIDKQILDLDHEADLSWIE